MNTTATRAKDIKRGWHLIDGQGEILGRVASDIAKFLTGKSKPYFVRNLDCGDYVVVVNAKNIRVTGKKLTDKVYTSYSGYPGGLKKEALKDLLTRKPTDVLKRAVYGMLPKNKLRDSMIKRLYIYPDESHPYKDKFKNV